MQLTGNKDLGRNRDKTTLYLLLILFLYFNLVLIIYSSAKYSLGIYIYDAVGKLKLVYQI